VPSDLEAVLNSYSCHSAYIQCLGLFTAFEELLLSSAYIQLKA
jgi:hypothetical protein